MRKRSVDDFYPKGITAWGMMKKEPPHVKLMFVAYLASLAYAFTVVLTM